jgi:catechol 2,3-dioxygenase-like lactoylglutathione lyase family enzyme
MPTIPSETILPVPALDHVVINARDRLPEAAACYRRLGFHLTPVGRHTLGSVNHLAVFGTDYLELVGVEPGAQTVRGEILRFPEGLNGLVFATESPDEVYAALKARGLRIGAPGEFSRPVTHGAGTEEARFRVTRLEPEAVSYGRVYYCQHLTRSLVWRDEWRHHPNGAVGVARAVICATDPDATADLYRRMFGEDAVRAVAGGFRLAAGLSHVDILSPRALADVFGAMAPDPQGRGDYMAALTFRTLSLDRAVRALDDAGVGFNRLGAAVVVPASDAFGATLEFVE